MKQWKRVSGVVLSGILALSMTLGGMTAPDAGAKAKKAKLKTKKICVTVGKKKTIKIVKKKKSCKYTFKSNKKKVAKVSKKGVVTGQKKGTAKITVKEVKNLSFSKDKINNINYGEDIVHQLIEVFNVVRKICIVAVLSLVLVTAFLIANTIKLAIYSRKREIEIMRLVGASNISIKIPFIIEGLFIGLIGSIMPILITIFGYTSLYDYFGGKLFGSGLAELVNPMPFIYQVSGVLVVIGIVVGMIGSYQAVRKYLKI